jgi:hypothetical protein
LPPFDPASIERFSVIRLEYQFDGDPVPQEKFFIVLGHKSEVAICIKATSNSKIYERPEHKRGCVFYAAGEIVCFPLDTYIQPDNQFPIHHHKISECHRKGKLKSWRLPDNFESRLRDAIRDSPLLSKVQKGRLFKVLDESW